MIPHLPSHVCPRCGHAVHASETDECGVCLPCCRQLDPWGQPPRTARGKYHPDDEEWWSSRRIPSRFRDALLMGLVWFNNPDAWPPVGSGCGLDTWEAREMRARGQDPANLSGVGRSER